MESKVMCMMLKVNISFQRLCLGDVVNIVLYYRSTIASKFTLIWPFWEFTWLFKFKKSNFIKSSVVGSVGKNRLSYR